MGQRLQDTPPLSLFAHLRRGGSLPFSLLFLLLFHNFRAFYALFAILLFFKNSSFL
jgi:hypothetical protein